MKEKSVSCSCSFLVLAAFFLLAALAPAAEKLHAAEAMGAAAAWEKLAEAARKEGKIVLGLPPSVELRKQWEAEFKSRWGIEIEPVLSPGPQIASRIASEKKGGVSYFDAFIVGTGTALPLAHAGMLEPLETLFAVPEVKDQKQWWGGHLWDDNASTNRFLYSFIADRGAGDLWQNSSAVKPGEIRSFDDFLNPKWKGRIGFADPRVPGAAYLTWFFLRQVKGESFLKELVKQELLVSRDPRQIADALAKGKLAIAVGPGYSQYGPFIQAGLPVKPLPPLKEGSAVNTGFGIVGVVKDPPHPHATKFFLNRLLGREEQEAYTKIMYHATRRLDVDTRWLVDMGRQAAKDVMTVEEFHRDRTQFEDRVTSRERELARKLAEEILK
jgi:iron(III) transport system substrate-binding protein